MTNQTTLPLDRLTPGLTINVRPESDDVADLVASIRAHGLLQPLVVRQAVPFDGDPRDWEVIDGNRRLKALKELGATDAEVIIRTDQANDAYEVSLAANILRRNLHPVVEFEAFAALVEDGKSIDDIAAHFGLTRRQVEGRRALGRLHPDVRKAWTEGRITGEAARAFTLVDQDQQAAYLAKATTSCELSENHIRGAFTNSHVSADHARVRFIGLEAYQQAGGAIAGDLFSDHVRLLDRALLDRLVEQQLKDAALAYAEAEGWKTGLTEAEAPERYTWARLTKPAPAEPTGADRERLDEINRLLAVGGARIEELTPDDEGEEIELTDEEEDEISAINAEAASLRQEANALRERAGWLTVPSEDRAMAVCIISLTHDGHLNIMRGYLEGVKPAKPKPASAFTDHDDDEGQRHESRANSTPVGDKPDDIALSAAMLDSLAQAATQAAQEVIATERQLALAALVATLLADSRGASPLRMTIWGQGKADETTLAILTRENITEIGKGFAHVYPQLVELPLGTLAELAVRLLAFGLCFTEAAIRQGLDPKAAQALRSSLPAVAHRAALVRAFDASAFFKSAPKSFALTAITDCSDDPGKYKGHKKADLAAIATRLAGEHGWLPRQLRGNMFTACAASSDASSPNPSSSALSRGPHDENGEEDAGAPDPAPALPDQTLMQRVNAAWQEEASSSSPLEGEGGTAKAVTDEGTADEDDDTLADPETVICNYLRDRTRIVAAEEVMVKHGDLLSGFHDYVVENRTALPNSFTSLVFARIVGKQLVDAGVTKDKHYSKVVWRGLMLVAPAAIAPAGATL